MEGEIPSSWTGRLQVVKIPVLPKLICRFNTILINTSRSFIGIDHLLLKCVWKGTGTTIAKTIFKEKNEVRGTTLPDDKDY